jgi:hypothetical protein
MGPGFGRFVFGTIFLIASYLAVQRIFNPHSLELNREGIIFRKGWVKPRQSFLPYSAVQNVVQEQSVRGGERKLILNNTSFYVRETYFETPATYADVCNAIAAGCAKVMPVHA